MEDAIQAGIENLTPTVAEFRGKKVADFIDKSILADFEREGVSTNSLLNTENNSSLFRRIRPRLR